MVRSCPTCGSRVKQVRERRRVSDRTPEFATVRWTCGTCGWSSDGRDSTPEDRPDEGGQAAPDPDPGLLD